MSFPYVYDLDNSGSLSQGGNPTFGTLTVTTLKATTIGVGTGATTPATVFHVASTSTSSPRGIMSSQHNAGTDGARLHMRKSRGTLASPSVITTGDNLGRLVASGHDGSNYLEMAGIIFGTEGTIAATRVPTILSFQTATDATPSVLTTRMTINSSGVVAMTAGVASSSTTTGTLVVTGGLGISGDVRADGSAMQIKSITISVGSQTSSSRLVIGSGTQTTGPGTSAAGITVAGITKNDNSTAASGTATINVLGASFASPTITATNANVTTADAVNVYIAAAVTVGSNQLTPTRNWALLVAAGATWHGGDLVVGTTLGTPLCTIAAATGSIVSSGSFTGGTPNGGTAAAWKPGVVVVSGTSTPLTDRFLQVDVAGTLYKIQLCSNA